MSDPNSPLTDPLQGKDGVTPAKETPWSEQELQQQAPNKPFELGEGPSATQPAEGTSPMDLAQGAKPAGEVTPETLQQQSLVVSNKANMLQQELTQERFDALTSGQKTLLNTKLTQFSDHVKGVSDQVGVPYEAPKPGSALEDIKPFLEYITKGQQQMSNVSETLSSATPGSISVTGMMRAQAQLMAANRAINFASAVVAQGASFLKQIMGTQV